MTVLSQLALPARNYVLDLQSEIIAVVVVVKLAATLEGLPSESPLNIKDMLQG